MIEHFFRVVSWQSAPVVVARPDGQPVERRRYCVPSVSANFVNPTCSTLEYSVAMPATNKASGSH